MQASTWGVILQSSGTFVQWISGAQLHLVINTPPELHFNFFMLWINQYPLSVAVMSPVNIAIIPSLKSNKCTCLWMLCACVYGTDKSKSSASPSRFIFLLKLVWLEIIRAWVWNQILKFTCCECLSFFSFLYSNANLRTRPNFSNFWLHPTICSKPVI